jgi:ABC-type uncharacterized transport system permease subunit
MMLLGVLGGMAWASIPAFLRNRFGANEILTSLMLVYVVQLLSRLSCARSVARSARLQLPEDSHLRRLATPALPHEWHPSGCAGFGHLIALALGSCDAHDQGLRDHVCSGLSPRAARFSGFSEKRTVLFCLLLSGGLAGLAGAFEISSVVGQLQPQISPGYGFAAIIVAFLGRLNPVGAIFAGLLLALSYIGGESGADALQVLTRSPGVIQGILLFYILACDTLINYRITGSSPAMKRA